MIDTKRTRGDIFIDPQTANLSTLTRISDERGPFAYLSGKKHRERAEFIVTACNAHDELVEALRELMPEGWADDDTMDHMPGVAKARAALAKAEREQDQ